MKVRFGEDAETNTRDACATLGELEIAIPCRYIRLCIFFVIVTASFTAKMWILRAWPRNLAHHFMFTAREQFSITIRGSMPRSRRLII